MKEKEAKQAILLLSNKSSEFVVSNFIEILESVKGYADAVFVYHQNDNLIPENIKNLNHYVFTNKIFDELDYIPLEKYSLLPGCDHFPLFKFYLEHPNYDYYWHIEDDVRFKGDWKYLLESFSDCDADFIACHVRTFEQDPNWPWWVSLKYQDKTISNDIKVRSFNAVRRISKKALAFLHQSMQAGWSGHHEVLMATLLYNNDFKITDFGGDGSFVPYGQENKFYTHESMSHLPIEMGDVENRIYHPIKEKKKINLEALKKYCVISAVGKNSLHREWIKEYPDFDLHLIVYDGSFNNYWTDTPFISSQKGCKLKLVYDYLAKNPVYLEKYDYFFIPDDDIQMNPANIAKLFNYMESYKLEIAQPALSDSYYTYHHTIKNKSTLLRFSNFVEMMAPCFSREALRKVMFTFNENKSGWGIEFHWSELIGFSGKEMAVIDDIEAVHTRPIQSFNEQNISELNNYILKYQLNREIREYGSIPNLNYKPSENNDWNPIVTEIEKLKEVEVRLERIADTLLQKINSVQGLGLLEGRAGISLFFYNYYRLTGKRKYLDNANAIFDLVNDNIQVLAHNFTLIDGMPGIAWSIEYLAQNKYIENNTDEVLEEICELLNEVDICHMYDLGLMTGLSGIGLHYASRLDNPNFTVQNSGHIKEKQITMILIDLLEEALQKKGHMDLIDNEQSLISNFCDLGIANGLLGIILFLCQVNKVKVHTEKLPIILNGYIKYLLSQQKEDNSGLHFSSNIHQSNEFLQWNYGDLAVAYTLFQAALATKNNEWKVVATEMALITTSIKGTESDYVGIYNGTMGIAHLYNHFYQHTLNNEFKKAAEYWIDKTLSANMDQGLIGLSIPQTKDGEPELGILKGLAGVGLALISTIADFQPNWDGCLGMQQIF